MKTESQSDLILIDVQVKQEIDRRIQEKDEEFESTRKNYQRTVDSMQVLGG